MAFGPGVDIPTRIRYDGPMTTKTKRTVDWEQLLQFALTAPGRLTNTYSRFHRYSYGNQMMLLMQGVMEPVAGYRKWESLGRQVRKGEKAKEIMVPYYGKRTNAKGVEEKVIVGFGFRNAVFGISQTDGEELPEVEIPTWDKSLALSTLGISEVPFEMIDGNVQGYSTRDKEIAVSPVAVYPTKTLFHEIGHIVAGHLDRTEETKHIGVAEFQAEAIAYLVMNELELVDQFDPAASRAYIQNWLGKHTPDAAEVRKVFSSVEKILRAGRPEEEK